MIASFIRGWRGLGFELGQCAYTKNIHRPLRITLPLNYYLIYRLAITPSLTSAIPRPASLGLAQHPVSHCLAPHPAQSHTLFDHLLSPVQRLI